MRRWLVRLTISLLTFLLGAAAARLHVSPKPVLQRQAESAITQPTSGNSSPTAEPEVEDCDPRVTGVYSNYDYAYAVVVPDGVIGAWSCVTNHGFGVDLTNPKSLAWLEQKGWPEAYLYVDASYNSAFMKSVNDEVQNHLRWLREGSNDEVKLISQTRTRLASLPAKRFIIRYRNAQEVMVADEVCAFRGGDIVYSINLTTPQSRYDKDKAVLEQMQKSWRLQPLPQ